MRYEFNDVLKEFPRLMRDIEKSVPAQYQAFMNSKNAITAGGKITPKMKWLLLLTASVTQKCPVCIPRAVNHCLEAGWSKDEMIEACMVAVLVGGSSAMTYALIAVKYINDTRK
ncbi:MAG: carboxymuconolactone decarboxylase family protein [Candidatus Omnitrophota bacterium]|jgi:alkylhydroperoxidase/carboxymuconolactone decarboxylase family protein YurZ